MEALSVCSVSGCGRRIKAKGLCIPHYARLCRNGDPLAGRTPTGELLRFIHEVALNHTGDECLAWPYGYRTDGYGSLKVGGKSIGAHRYVCQIVNGEPPTADHQAAHSCGKGHEGCIAPGHLEWKTPVENNADKLIHDSHNRGERHCKAKLTEEQVREILALKGIETQHSVAKQFGVMQPTISDIFSGRSWAWLSEASA